MSICTVSEISTADFITEYINRFMLNCRLLMNWLIVFLQLIGLFFPPFGILIFDPLEWIFRITFSVRNVLYDPQQSPLKLWIRNSLLWSSRSCELKLSENSWQSLKVFRKRKKQFWTHVYSSAHRFCLKGGEPWKGEILTDWSAKNLIFVPLTNIKSKYLPIA